MSCGLRVWCDRGRSGDVIIPRRERKDEWNEYCDGRDPGECASEEYFCQVLRTADELKHIKHARKCFNFQHCKVRLVRYSNLT